MNMGMIDRGLRLVLAVALTFAAVATDILGDGIIFWGALGIAAVSAVTALVGTCPLYSALGIQTCRVSR